MTEVAVPATRGRKQPAVAEVLQRHFGFSDLRPGQAEAIEALMKRRDALVVMPTGAGKSLVYQLAACMMPCGVSVVISPLIALMKDQVDGLAARRIPAVLVNSSQSPREQEDALACLVRREVRMVYAAPERLRSPRFMDAIVAAGVNLLAVDEAHCVSQWGHDFRPDYRAIAEARLRMGSPPCVALTATATPRVQADIVAQLRLREPARLVSGFNRPNIEFAVRSTPTLAEKRSALKHLLAEQVDRAGLVYVATRKEAEQVHQFVSEGCRLPVRTYHAGMDDRERTLVQDDFMRGRTNLIVATNAFGMGVDRPDVRFVVHWSLPGNLESYYQEAGRAGRDGLPALASLFYSPRDRGLREWFIEQNAPDSSSLRALYHAAQRQLRSGSVTAEPEQLIDAADLHPVSGRVALGLLEKSGALERLDSGAAQRSWRVGPWDSRKMEKVLEGVQALQGFKLADLDRMIEYAESGLCRRRHILEHFGDEGLVQVDRCCDNCTARAGLAARPPDVLPEFSELPEQARIAIGLLDAVRRLPWSAGRKTLVKMLTGSRAEGMLRYEQSPYFGRLKSVGQNQVDDLYRQLIVKGYLRVAGSPYPVVELTPRGEQAIAHRSVDMLDVSDVVESIPRRKRRTNQDQSLDEGGRLLFEELRGWRTEMAKALGVPPYVVLGDVTLRGIAARRPRTVAELLDVKGIGPVKADVYGEAILSRVRQS